MCSLCGCVVTAQSMRVGVPGVVQVLKNARLAMGRLWSGLEWSPPHQVTHDMRATQGYSGLLWAANTNKVGNRKVKRSKPYNFPLGVRRVWWFPTR
jgi:hypothetical protein